ncbi:MAG: hypothetical protein U1A78_01295 [Polyangia bacterium]
MSFPTKSRGGELLFEQRTRTAHFAERPVSTFREGDFVGFFTACREAKLFGDGDVVIARGSSEGGSVTTCELDGRAVPGGELYLLIENDRLSLRVRAPTDSQRKKLREQAEQALATAGLFTAEGTPRLLPAPSARRTSLVALLEGAIGEPLCDTAALRRNLTVLRGALECAAASLSRSPVAAAAKGRGA